MEKAVGVVLETKDNIAKVKINRSSMCGESCGSCNLCKNNGTTVIANNDIGANVNENVELEMEISSGLKAAFLVYGVPIIILIIGVIVVSLAGFNQGLGLLYTLFAIVFWFAVVKIIDKNMKSVAKITKIINEV